jgi:hypothetical protein
VKLAILTIALSSVLLGACNQTTAQPPAAASTNVTAASFKMPDGTGCQGEIERYRAIMTNDLAMGHVSPSVHGRVETEIGRAEAACTAGRDAEALRMVDATKGRYGYR